MLLILEIIIGALLVIKGADWLTSGSVAVATRLGVSQMVIGLTIVAMGTSMPEFCVSLVSAIHQSPGLAIGNVVGSNIFNAMLIVGITAMVAPMAISHTTIKRDVPVAVLASVVLAALCADGLLNRLDAALLFAMFVIYMWLTLRNARQEADDSSTSMSIIKSVVFILLGLAGLVFGSNIFVSGATGIARSLGVSDAVIGLTIVAGGTSLPELATSVVAARKGNSAIAIGNVLGSNVFNILFILGITGMICPMQTLGITWVDFAVMTISMVLLWLFAYTKYIIERWEGALLTALFIGYLSWLVANAI